MYIKSHFSYNVLGMTVELTDISKFCRDINIQYT